MIETVIEISMLNSDNPSLESSGGGDSVKSSTAGSIAIRKDKDIKEIDTNSKIEVESKDIESRDLFLKMLMMQSNKMIDKLDISREEKGLKYYEENMTNLFLRSLKALEERNLKLEANLETEIKENKMKIEEIIKLNREESKANREEMKFYREEIKSNQDVMNRIRKEKDDIIELERKGREEERKEAKDEVKKLKDELERERKEKLLLSQQHLSNKGSSSTGIKNKKDEVKEEDAPHNEEENSTVTLIRHIMSNKTKEDEDGKDEDIKIKTKSWFDEIKISTLSLKFISDIFLFSVSSTDWNNISYFTYVFVSWVSFSMCSNWMFPILTGKHYDDNNLEISPLYTDKVLIFVLLWISSIVIGIISGVSFNSLTLRINPEWFPPDLKEAGKTSLIDIFCARILIYVALYSHNWYTFLLIILIGSTSNIPKLDPNIEIMLFGYLFPFIKSIVCSISYYIQSKIGRESHWSQEKKATAISNGATGSVILCTISQMYIIYRSSSDYSFFLKQYLPHEIIKKLSWLTFHPLYLKIKLQVVYILKESFRKIFGNKEKVMTDKRFTQEVINSMNETAADIIGRQFGEDLCMILLTMWMLPICQENLFPPLYPLTVALIPLPTYTNIGTTLIGTAYLLETVLTLGCFAVLQRIGIPLESNTSMLHLKMQTYFLYLFYYGSFLIVLMTTVCY